MQPFQVNYALNDKITEKSSVNYNIMLYKCDICYDYFISKEELLIHLKMYHSQEHEDIKILTEEFKEKYYKRLLSNYDN